MQFRSLAALVLALFLSPEASTGSRVVGSNISVAEETEQVIYNRGFLSYDLLVGEFSQEAVGGAVRYRPTGDGDHFLEFAWADTPGEVVSIELNEEGELWRGDDWILLDVREQGRVDVGDPLPGGGVSSGSIVGTCDAVITDVKKITYTGGCWGTTRVEGDSIHKKCDADNEEGCVASVEHGDDEVSEYTWACDQKKDKYIQFNGGTGVALIEHADSGPGC